MRKEGPGESPPTNHSRYLNTVLDDFLFPVYHCGEVLLHSEQTLAQGLTTALGMAVSHITNLVQLPDLDSSFLLMQTLGST